jgi:hypothetical protein
LIKGYTDLQKIQVIKKDQNGLLNNYRHEEMKWLGGSGGQWGAFLCPNSKNMLFYVFLACI